MKNKQATKENIKELLKEFIPEPNNSMLSVSATYDPNLQSITITYYDLWTEKNVIILDELIGG